MFGRGRIDAKPAYQADVRSPVPDGNINLVAEDLRPEGFPCQGRAVCCSLLSGFCNRLLLHRLGQKRTGRPADEK